MFKIYGDYGYNSETLLKQFDTASAAVRWVERYVADGDLGGYSIIEVARFHGEEYVVERRWDADDYADESMFECDDDFAVEEDF